MLNVEMVLAEHYLMITVATIAVAALLILYLTFGKKRKLEKLSKSPSSSLSEEAIEHRIRRFIPDDLSTVADSLFQSTTSELSGCSTTSSEGLNLAQVNFMDLLHNKELQVEADKCIRGYGVGSCGPRGFYGTIDVHLTLEQRLAQFLGYEECILYSYGFSTISSAVGAYCKKSDIVFTDEKINMSVRQGLSAAKCMVINYYHNDHQDLLIKMLEYERKEVTLKKPFNKFVIVEGIYQSTGTICPLHHIVKLCKRFKARIFIDESLSVGVIGETGRGITEHCNVDTADVDMIMGTLEGSTASIGGFCVGAASFLEHQRLSGLGYCFSASLPPYLSRVAICALNVLDRHPHYFKELAINSTIIDQGLRRLGYYLILSDVTSPVKVITVRDPERRLKYVMAIHSFFTQNEVHIARHDCNLHFHVCLTFHNKKRYFIVKMFERAFEYVDNMYTEEEKRKEVGTEDVASEIETTVSTRVIEDEDSSILLKY